MYVPVDLHVHTVVGTIYVSVCVHMCVWWREARVCWGRVSALPWGAGRTPLSLLCSAPVGSLGCCILTCYFVVLIRVC